MELSTEAEDAAAQWPAWGEGNHTLASLDPHKLPTSCFINLWKLSTSLSLTQAVCPQQLPEVSYHWWCRSASSYSWDFFMKVICQKHQTHLYSSITLRWAQTNMLSCSCMFVCSSVTSWEKCTTSYLCRDVKVELNIYSLDFKSWFIIKL